MSSSTELYINNIPLTPLKDAARDFSYSKDYVARLAREQKIVATQIGRQWFVDTVSLRHYAEVSELEREARHRQLREERKSEQIVKEKIAVLKDDTRKQKHLARIRFNTHVLAGAVASVGIVVGATLYTQVSLGVGAATVAAPAAVAPEVPVALVEMDVQPLALATDVQQKPVFTATTTSLAAHNNPGVIIFPATVTATGAAAIAQQFSDDVSVEYVDDRIGMITYTAPDGTERSYTFVVTPHSSGTVSVQ